MSDDITKQAAQAAAAPLTSEDRGAAYVALASAYMAAQSDTMQRYDELLEAAIETTKALNQTESKLADKTKAEDLRREIKGE